MSAAAAASSRRVSLKKADHPAADPLGDRGQMAPATSHVPAAKIWAMEGCRKLLRMSNSMANRRVACGEMNPGRITFTVTTSWHAGGGS